ncbi:cytochrome P450 7B1 [Polymixia lowei]
MLGILLLALVCFLSCYLLCLRRGRTSRDNEPPLIKGWIPFLGKAVDFGRDAHTFLAEHKEKYGDIFTVQIAGKYMTFIMNPLLYPYIIKHGRQLDFHQFSDQVAPPAFGYPPVLSSRFPGLHQQIQRSFRLLQGDNLTSLTESMMGNLMRVFQQDHLGRRQEEQRQEELEERQEEELEERQDEEKQQQQEEKQQQQEEEQDEEKQQEQEEELEERQDEEKQQQEGEGEEGGSWRTGSMYEFCSSVMFEATFLTMYGKPAHASRHSGMSDLREDFIKFDNMFPLLIARIPIWLLGRTKAVREKLLTFLVPQRMSCWSEISQFIMKRSQLFEQYDLLGDIDKAAHHLAILWASVGNTVPATFWAMYYLVSHPAALQAIRQEIHTVLGLSGAEDVTDISLTREQLDQLLYLESAISESLRLSSASMNIRVVQEDFSLQLEGERSVAVRKGDIIALYPQSMHMDPEIYQEPERYRYDRFMEDGREKTDFYKDGQRLKYYLMPFGSGSTMCPGRYFAVNEIKQFLCLLLLNFDLEVEEGQSKVALDSSRAGLGILLPANDVRFRYRPRRA